MSTRRIGIATLWAFLAIVASLASPPAEAAAPDDAPAVCRAQVANALKVLEPMFVGKTRSLGPRAKGTIEHAVESYAPPRFHPVDEGTLAAPTAGARCRPEMADVDGRFCVDRYEASLDERKDDGTLEAHSPYEGLLEGHVYVAKSVSGVVPQGYVSAKQASGACQAAGKRLCYPVEWRAACAGREGYAYPYGPTRTAGKCHDTGKSPMLAFHAATMKRGWGVSELNDPRNNRLEGTVAKTGAFADCVNDYGVYDMVGNLDEWTADPNGTFQGGYWLDTSEHGDGCAYRTIAHGFTYRDYSTGFRCCADPTVASTRSDGTL